jgi:hypothetical protein
MCCTNSRAMWSYRALAFAICARTRKSGGVSNHGEKLRAGDPARLASVTISKPAPDFKLQSLTGQQISLNSFRGKQPVVLVFIDGDM